MVSLNDVLTEKEIQEEEKKLLKFEEKKKKELKKLEERRRKEELKEIKNTDNFFSKRKEKLTTTKILMYIILINCMVIEIYSMVAMIVLQDLSALYALIGAVVGESVTYAIYCAKSFNDTKEEVNSKLERDKFESMLDLNENGIPDVDEPEELDENGDPIDLPEGNTEV